MGGLPASSQVLRQSANLQSGYPATILTFLSLLLLAIAFAWAVRLDSKASNALVDEEVESMLLVSRQPKSTHELEAQTKHRACCSCLGGAASGPSLVHPLPLKTNALPVTQTDVFFPCAVCGLFGGMFAEAWLVSTMFEVEAPDNVSELLDTAKTASVNRCIASIHSYRAGACRQSIRVVMKSTGERKLRQRSSFRTSQGEESELDHTQSRATTASASAVTATWGVHYHGVWAVEKFLHASWCMRIVLLLPAMHPWMALALVSLFGSHKRRAALIILKLATATFTSALFFTNGAQSFDSDAVAQF